MKHLSVILFLFNSFFLINAQNVDTQSFSPDSVELNLAAQTILYPQEKIYIQTDKPCYLSGEKIFYRIFLLNASSHKPHPLLSRYVYTELVDPFDSVVVRQQIRPDNNMFFNAIELPPEIAQGMYRIRAYTRFMENSGEKYFFTKPLYVTVPGAAKMKMDIKVEKLDDKHTGVSLKFSDIKTGETMKPKQVSMRLNSSKSVNEKPDDDGWIRRRFDLTDKDTTRTLFVDYIEDDKTLFSQFVGLPFVEGSVDVSFYPEGGHLVAGMLCRTAFKALAADGNAVDISGKIVDSDNNHVAELKTRNEGIGAFTFMPDPQKRYFAQFEYKGKQHQIPVPSETKSAPALKGIWQGNTFLLSVLLPEHITVPKLYVMAHCRGELMYIDEWDAAENSIQIDRAHFNNGVTHFLLLDKDFNPLSERLVFKFDPDDCPETEITVAGKTEFNARDSITLKIAVNDLAPDTITASMSLSVTDDRDIQIDSASNILSEILLASELEGYIPNSAYYLAQTQKVRTDADLLMLTHGWRRYNIAAAAAGKIESAKLLPEQSHVITGDVNKGLLNKPFQGARVSVYSTDGSYFDMTESDEKGKFKFSGFELADSSGFVVQATTPKGSKTMIELRLDSVTYPLPTALSRIPIVNFTTSADYIEKADLQYTTYNGLRNILLKEVVISRDAKSKKKYGNSMGFEATHSINEETIARYHATDMKTLLRMMPGVIIINDENGENVKISRFQSYEGYAMIRLDGSEYKDPSVLFAMPVDMVAQIDVLTDPGPLNVYRAPCGIIDIMTKKGDFVPPSTNLNIKKADPLGYSPAVEFYAPRYDTPESRLNKTPDLRSVIYWKPNISANAEGEAEAGFYAADAATTYSVVLEGIGANGELIYKSKKSILKIK